MNSIKEISFLDGYPLGNISVSPLDTQYYYTVNFHLFLFNKLIFSI